MKTSIRISLVAIALLLMSQITFAQVRVNPKVGLNVSAVDANLNDFSAEARTGWNAGVDFRLGEGVLFLNPGLHYYSFTARLVQDIDENTNVNFREETTIQSLKAPINVGLRITGDNGLLGIYAKGGIAPTYVMGVSEADDFDFNVDDLNRFTWGANMGVGVDILFLTADLTYEKGLTDFFDGVEGRNNVLTLSVGLKF